MSGDSGWHRSKGRETDGPDPRAGRPGGYGYPPAGDGYQVRYPQDGDWPQDDDYERPGQHEHGTPGGYGGQGGGHRDYDTADGYGGQADTGYYRQPRGYGGQPGYGSGGDDSSYGQGSRGSYGQDSYDSFRDDSYGRDGYGQDSYGAADPYGQAGRQTGHGSDTGHGWEQIGRNAADPYLGTGQSGHADAAYGAADTGSYGRSGPGTYDTLGAAPYSGWPGEDRQDRDDYAAGHSSYDPADSGVYDWADSGSFDRHDTGSFGRDRRQDRGRDEPVLPGRGQLSAGRDGYASWHDDPEDEPLWEPQDDEAWEDDGRHPGDRDRGGWDRGDRGGAYRGRKDRGKPPRRARGRVASSIALLIVLAVIGGAGFAGYRFIHSWIIHRYGDYTGPGTGTVKITVPQGASLVGLGPILLKENVIMALRPYDSAAGRAPNASSLQPGTYLLRHHMKSALVVQLLLSGKTRVNNTFTVYPDGRAADIASLLAKSTHLPLSQFLQIIDHPPAALGLPPWASGHTAEGFLFPDTYRLAPNQTPLQILQAMVADFKNRTASLKLPSAAASVYTTPFHIIVVASLIQAEGNATDFRQISRVVWNRLKDNMPLQFDSTVFYAMHKFGTAITQAEEKYPSPYNTYLHNGLPPGPIGSPGLAAIQAALHPVEGKNWLYFITDTKSPTHKTYFTASLAQFQKWQAQFQG